MTRLIRQFWTACLVTLTIVVLLLYVTWRPQYQQLPPRPPLWFGGETYLSEYGTHGSSAHYIYRFGLFGLRERLQASDLFFLGSSHVEYGVSAAQASSELSRATGRPIRAYNLAVGFGEGIGFATQVLTANDLRDKTVVLDLFSPLHSDGSSYDRVVGQSNSLDAYLKVWDIWLRYADDYLLDPILPNFSTQTGTKLTNAITRSRLLGVCNMRDWNSGDVAELWTPTLGPVYAHPAATIPHPLEQGDPENFAVYGEWKLPPATLAFFAERHLQVAYTFLPFAGYEYTTTPAAASPLLHVSLDGLQFFDWSHVTAASRTVVTSQLVEGIERAGLFK